MNAMKTLLLTGFAPWDDYERNAASELLRVQRASDFRGWYVRTQVVPVSWQRAWPTVAAAWDQGVRALVAFGQAEDDSVRLERFAVNASSQAAPDVDGLRFEDDWNIAGGPLALHTGLPWRRLQQALAAAGLPVRTSLGAGDYLCNHLAYRILHRAAQRSAEDGIEVTAGFIHVPTLARMTMADLNRVREVVVAELIDHLEQPAPALVARRD